MSFSLSGLLFRQRKNKQDNKDAHLPRHVAIIMDGNGRWAARRRLPRTAGHYAGMTALRRIVRCASELGIAVLTVYAFSTENWTRPKEEVDFLMKLPQEFLEVNLPELKRNNVRVKLSGNPGGLPSIPGKRWKLPLLKRQTIREWCLTLPLITGGVTK